MSASGFPAGTLGDDGFPIWVTDLAAYDYLSHTVHVVRGLGPADALQVLGAQTGWIVPCQLPAWRTSGESLPRVATGPADCGSVLLAGQAGAWTFIHDEMGLTAFDNDPDSPSGCASPAKMLSADGKAAASSAWTFYADTSLAYAVNGELLLHLAEDVDPAKHDIPAGLQAAVEAAAKFEPGGGEDDQPDCGINMRVLCALAGLNGTLNDLREIPLLAAPFSPKFS